jgi:hypothetical protein
MRHCKLLIGCGVIMATMLAPAAAQADGFISPNIGMSFGGDLEDSRPTYGVTLGFMGAGIFGMEFDLGYTPEFFEPPDDDLDLIDDSNLLTANINLILGAPIGGMGRSVRPYGSGGLSILRSRVDALEDLRISNTDFGFNVGAGVMGFFSDSVGLRGDVRYYRNLEDPDEDDEFDVSVGDFDFWRATLGLVFRFGG